MCTVSIVKLSSCATVHRNGSDWQTEFERLLPEIEKRLRLAFSQLTGEEKDEAIQEATCNACRAYALLVRRGRTNVATARSLARFAAAHYRVGRRVGGSLNVNDVCSEYCRYRRGVRLERLDRRDREGWREVLVEDRTVTPAELAASRIDYPAFLASLSRRHRRIAEALASGESTGGVARLSGLSEGRISQLRREFYLAWQRFHGEPVAGTAAAVC